MTFSQSSIPTCLAHLILAGVTGWSLKQIPTNTSITGNNIDTSSPFMSILFVFLLLHSLLGIFRHSHPEPHKNLRKLYELSVLLAVVLPVPLLNVQLYYKYYLSDAVHLLVNGYLLGTVFVPFLIGFIYSELSRRHISDRATSVAAVINLIVLLWLSLGNENYWGVGLCVSYAMKHFALPQLANRYSVPFIDLYTYGLGFFEIFAVNVIIDADLYRTELVVQ
ncbi:uncharacterized protein LOC129737922 [Uranotaenia lowii]|uniref:uncharacterized protein LOC129737922 n=1 Tax=Uranotaenia lowii TaxID=190385 RepID=UPI002479F213|nr:uncharacterized protein LOC129737922 [Uranotaenia lowii]